MTDEGAVANDVGMRECFPLLDLPMELVVRILTGLDGPTLLSTLVCLLL
jgi:hypothetical protein